VSGCARHRELAGDCCMCVSRVERELVRLEVGWLAYLKRWSAGHAGQLTIADVGAVERASVVE
jgi:hypothetical protein